MCAIRCSRARIFAKQKRWLGERLELSGEARLARTPIHAAGGIVYRGRKRPLVAVVQRSKDERWVLPRGKLKREEDPMAGARREVVEETGHRVRVHEFRRRHHLSRAAAGRSWCSSGACRPRAARAATSWRHHRGRMAAAQGGGAAAELSAGEAVPAQVGRRVLRRKARRKAAARKSKASRAKPARRKATRKTTRTTTRKTKRVAPQTRRRAPDGRRRPRTLKRRAR